MRDVQLKRRGFLKGALGMAGSSAALSMGGGLLGAFAPAVARAQLTDYKALVCVYFYGGNDSFNWLIPRSTAGYGAYAEPRASLAIPRSSLLPIQPLSGLDLGLHPACPGIQTLFADHDAAFIANCGVLLAPTDRAGYEANRSLPPALFSHNDQQDHWMTASPTTTKLNGWGGRLHTLLGDANGSSPIAMNLSLSGNNLYQSGGPLPAYILSGDGAALINEVHSNSANYHPYFEGISLAEASANPLERALARSQRSAFEVAEIVDFALQDTAPPAAVFDEGTDLGSGLRTTAHMIAAHALLGTQRQIFFVGMGGFDTHDSQAQTQPRLFSDMDGALSAFQSEMRALGLADSVTLFTMSEFGRTLTSNGDGTDHGWGAHHLVMGGAVKGGQVYGSMPDLTVDGPQDAGFGRIIPSTSTDQYFASLARWFGATNTELASVFRNLPRFAPRTLGFMT